MHQKILPEKGKKTKRHKFVSQCVAGLLAGVMALSTTMVLAPSVFAQEQEEQKETSSYTCGLEEHAHTKECYEKVTTVQEQVLSRSVNIDGVTIVHTHNESCYDKEGALVCTLSEQETHEHTAECYSAPVLHAHSESCYTTSESPVCGKTEETKEADGQLICEKEELTCGKEETEEHTHSDLCYGTWELTCELEEHIHDEECEELSDNEEMPLDLIGAEQPIGTNWLAGPTGGDYTPGTIVSTENSLSSGLSGSSTARMVSRSFAQATTGNQASAVQINEDGGERTNEDGVTVSKTITGTETENVFDITLRVDTKTDIQEFLDKPDMAAVIVMDISKTMNSNFGNTTRYKAAMDAAEVFVDLFAGNSSDASKLGVVAFNTNAHLIEELQTVNTTEEAKAFSRSMKSQTDNIIYNYKASGDGTRFTNIEAGLKYALDLLDDEQTENKFVLFLSDGMPTTYIKEGYMGYIPESSNYLGTKQNVGKPGNFYDGYNDSQITAINYSDMGADRADDMAANLRSAGISIYVAAVGMESVDSDLYYQLVTRPKNNGVCTVDCPLGTTGVDSLVVGGNFTNWLTTAIASNNQFINCGNPDELEVAYSKIFESFKQTSIENSAELWTVTDKIPNDLEFISFVDKQGSIIDSNGNLHTALTGELVLDAENSISNSNGTLNWNLKESGFTSSTSGNTTSYTYVVTYRVRLKNEANGFVEMENGNPKIYPTNTNAVLTYNTVTTTNNVPQYSSKKTETFDVPSVFGYLGELKFTKKDQGGKPLAGATFTLSHATACNVCRGDNTTSVTVADMTAASDANGQVMFSNIPSGHIYTLQETGIPNGYTGDSEVYTVTVAYDEVTVAKADGTEIILDTVTNRVLEVETTITGTKTLTNPNGAEHTYTFELVEVEDKNGAPKDGAVAERKTVTFDSEAPGNGLSFIFEKLTYKGTDLGSETSKTYYYKVSEKETDSESLDADENFYIVEVVVALNENKTILTATPTIYKNGTGNAVNTIEFTNTLLGALSITKEVDLVDDSETTDQSFAIVVKKGSEPLSVGTEYTVSGKIRSVEADGIIRLKAGETALLEGLTVGDTYTVTEQAESAYGYTVQYEPASVIILEKTDENPSVSIKVTNTEQTADLAIEGTKNIANPDGKEYEYTFQMQEVNADGNAIGDPVTQTVKTDKSGTFCFPLSYKGTMLEGQSSKTYYYRITEATPSDLTVSTDPAVYLMTVKLESENGALTAAIGDIQKTDGTITTKAGNVSFTNVLLGSLTLNKQIVGEYPDGETFTFTITGLPDGNYAAALNGAEHSVNVTDGACSIKLTHKDSLVIYGIPHGTKVTITEEKSAYTVRYTVDSSWIQRDGNSATAEVTTSGTEVLFKNYSPYGLPQTGQLKWVIPVLAVLGAGLIGLGFFTQKRKKYNGK